VKARTPPSRAALVSAAGRDHLEQIKRLPAVIRDTAYGVAKVRRRSRERGKHLGLATPFSSPPTFINHSVSPGRRFATATLALSDVKQTTKQLGITINDLVLSISAGALRDLLLRYDGKADQPIVASVPVNTDTSPARISGNALGAMFVSLPVQLDDPSERVSLVSVSTGIGKENTRLLGADLLGRWTAYTPPPVAPAAFRWLAKREAQMKLYNVSVSNVCGPTERGRVGGASIGEFYSVGPLTPGTGMNITVWSYADQVNISVLTDDRSVGDSHEVTDAMLQEFAEIRCSCGLSSELTEVETAMAQADDAGRGENQAQGGRW
jgi:diacylglycerol O-acyltransferase / wax synthase